MKKLMYVSIVLLCTVCVANAAMTDWQTLAAATAGNVVADDTGWVFTGTAADAVSFNYGALDGGGTVDGSTVEFIVNLTDSASTSALGYMKGDSAAAPVEGDQTDTLTLKMEQYSNKGKLGLTTPGVKDTTLTTATPWDQDAHLVFVADGAGAIDVYLNGIWQETSTDQAFQMDGGLGALGVAISGGGTQNDPANGTIYAVGTYNVPLTPGQIAALATAAGNGPEPTTTATLLTPLPNGATNVAVDTMLAWEGPGAYTAAGYDVWFGTEPDSQSPDYDMIQIKDHASFGGTSADPLIYYTTDWGQSWYDPGKSQLDHGTTYFWYVVAYEGQTPHTGDAWSFTTYNLPTPPCSTVRFDGDIDGDCFVDITDLMLLVQDWMQTAIVADSDINEDSKVDMADFSYISRDWKTFVNDGISIMILSCHPDDEGIFFGGVMSYYPQVQNVRTVHVSMTSGDWNRPPEDRETELTNADAIYYGRSITTSIGSPLDTSINPSADLFFPRFKDEPTSTVDQTWDWWYDGILDGDDVALGRQKAIDTLATYIRILKPTVIVGHDIDGEYGHPNHKATGIAMAECYDRAADSGYVDGNDPWLAMKLYIHQSEGNGLGTPGYTFINWLFHDYLEETTIDTDDNGSPDMTPRQVTNVGLKVHYSQGSFDASTVYVVGENHDSHHSEWWGLYRSTVGPDTIADPFTIEGKDYNDGSNDGWAIGNFFENIPGY